MDKPRKIVVILGNGFDLDLGLKTSYKDFWESEFCPKAYPAPIIKYLNGHWPDNLDKVRWYDLENELLNYYKERNKTQNYPDVISPELLEYVRKFDPYNYFNESYSTIDKRMIQLFELGIAEYKTIRQRVSIPYLEDLKQPQEWRDFKALEYIKGGLCRYLKSIDKPSDNSNTVAYNLLLTLSKTVEKGDNVSIYSFNYTPVQMRGYSLDGIALFYMHGDCEDGKIIIGTKDDLGIGDDYDFLQKVMDDSFSPPDLVTALKESDEVIIFGHSLGENDSQYFAPFFLHQASYDKPEKKSITIFTRDYDSQRDIKRALQKITLGRLSTLYSINQPIIIKTGCINEDQNLLRDFLVNHNTEKHFAESIIGRVLQKGRE